MPRIRTIKPEIHQSRKVGKLSDLAFRLFIGMISLADDAGRLRGDPETLRASILPYQRTRKDADVTDAMNELSGCQLVVWYGKENEFAYLPGWGEHQKISHPSSSRLPSPESSVTLLNSPEDSRVLQNVPHGSDLILSDLIGRDGKVVVRSSSDDSRPPNGPTEIPPEWQEVKSHLDTLHWLKRPELYDWAFWKRLDEAFEDFPDLSVNAELSRAEAWLMANPRKAKTKKRWQQFVMNWFQIAAERKAKHEKGKTG